MGLVYLGESPADEECAPATDYTQSKKECRVLVRQLKRMFPEYEKYNCTIKMTRENYDGGSFDCYYTVHVFYEDDNEESIGYAYQIEAGFPVYWDEIAKIELGPTLPELIEELPADLAAGPETRYDTRRKVLPGGAS